MTGGAGYIGSHTARALRSAGYEVVLYDNLSTGFRCLAEGFELVEGDIADEAKLRSVLRRVDAVMHFAAHAYVGESVENPRKYFRNNVDGALSFLNSVLDAGIRRFVFSSTCAVYGIPARIPITEQTPREPVNPYGASKLFLENALEAYSRAYELRSVRLRYFNAAGADESGEIGELHDPETHLIPLALAASTGNGAELQVYGDRLSDGGWHLRSRLHSCERSCRCARSCVAVPGKQRRIAGGESGNGPGTFRSGGHPGSGTGHGQAGPAQVWPAAAGRSSSFGGRSVKGPKRSGMDGQAQSQRHCVERMEVDGENKRQRRFQNLLSRKSLRSQVIA